MPRGRSVSDAAVRRSATRFQSSIVATPRPALAMTIRFDPMITFRSMAFLRPSGVNTFAPLCVDGAFRPTSSSNWRTCLAYAGSHW